MGDNTGIEWTDATWNPTTGCTKVSQGCKHCYAERDWPRLVHLPAYQGREFTDVACHPERLDQPLRWRKPRRIFVNSMSDLFHESVPDEFIDQVFAVMALAHQHTFQVLTKRPARMLAYMNRLGRSAKILEVGARIVGYTLMHDGICLADWPIPNVYLGVSVEDQVTADERIPLLLQTPAAVRWISAEPLLGPIDLRFLQPADPPTEIDALNGTHGVIRPHRGICDRLDWVVAGGESGPKARPSHPDWFRSLRDQCKAAGVPFLFKQWGEWSASWGGGTHLLYLDGRLVSGHHDHPDAWKHRTAEPMMRSGKKAAGRLLDEVLHDEYPW